MAERHRTAIRVWTARWVQGRVVQKNGRRVRVRSATSPLIFNFGLHGDSTSMASVEAERRPHGRGIPLRRPLEVSVGRQCWAFRWPSLLPTFATPVQFHGARGTVLSDPSRTSSRNDAETGCATPLERKRGHAVGQRRHALGMHVTVEQADERAVNLSKRVGLLLWHHRALRLVAVGETIRGSPAQDNSLITFGRI
jgi:hypothetical protein